MNYHSEELLKSLSLRSTHSKTAMLKGFCKLPRYSPIICLLRPFLVMRNLATPRGEFSRNPRAIRYAMPRSGFLLNRFRPTRYWRLRTVSDTWKILLQNVNNLRETRSLTMSEGVIRATSSYLATYCFRT